MRHFYFAEPTTFSTWPSQGNKLFFSSALLFHTISMTYRIRRFQGKTFDEACEAATQFAASRKLDFYDGSAVIAQIRHAASPQQVSISVAYTEQDGAHELG